MANMDVTQRNQYERTTLAGSSERIRRGSERGVKVYLLFALPIAALLCYATLKAMDGWWQWLVLGVIVALTYAFMMAVGPKRKGAGQGSTPTGD